MEQFIYGLFTGVALGMWLAILLYTLAGKRQHGWPRWSAWLGWSLRRKQQPDKAPAAQEPVDGPADDFTDAYYAQFPPHKASPASAAPAPLAPPAPAPLSDIEEAGIEQDEVDSGEVDTDEIDTDEVDADDDESEEYPVEAAPVIDTGQAYKRLVAKMDGDVDAAQRLIDAERQRTPNAPIATLLQNALDRLDYGAS